MGLPDIDDVREGVIATRIAAHAADIAKGLPQAIAWDREMAVARKNLDWPEQIRLALDPVKAQAYRDKKNKAEDEACSMCGDYCAVKIVGQYLEAHRKNNNNRKRGLTYVSPLFISLCINNPVLCCDCLQARP